MTQLKASSPLAVEDILEIQALYACYARAADSGDSGACADCFTEDGTFTRANGRVSTGRAELLEIAERAVGVRHFYTNLLIEPDGEGARASCYNLRIRTTDSGGPSIHAIGLMSDQLVRTAEGWRFRSRTSTGW